MKLPSTHDLKLVGTPVPGTLQVDFTWDSDGKSANLTYGDGASVTSTAETASHTYAAHQVYVATVTSGRASDSATLDLTAADEPEPEPEPDPQDDGSDDGEPEPYESDQESSE